MYGLKFWELEIIVMIAVMIFAGLRQYHLSGSRMRIRRRFNERFFKFLSVIFTVVFTVLFFKESSDILIKFGYQSLSAGDSEFYAFVVAGLAGMTISFMFYGICYGIGTITGYAKRGYLLDNLQ